MIVTKQNVKFKDIDYMDMLYNIESAARTCYQSQMKENGPNENFIRNLIKKGHESVIEFADLTITATTNRGVSHELVRHRLASYAQESTRYVNYYKRGLKFIQPVWLKPEHKENGVYDLWLKNCRACEQAYFQLIDNGCSPQEARDVLNNSVATNIVMKANIREWRHTLKLRTSKQAHPQIRALMIDVLKHFKQRYPVFFEDIPV